MVRGMFAIAVANSKGGSGKTTVATHLAARFAAEGRHTVLADLDRQRSALAWAARRPPDLAPVRGVDLTKVDGGGLPKAERVVIDVPAGLRRKEAAEVVRLVDVVLVPVTPSAFDEAATASFLAKLAELKPVRKAKRAVGLIENRLRPRTKAAEHLDAFLAGLGHPVVARLRDAQLYAAAAASGVTLFDQSPATRGARDHLAEWQPLLRFIDGAM